MRRAQFLGCVAFIFMSENSTRFATNKNWKAQRQRQHNVLALPNLFNVEQPTDLPKTVKTGPKKCSVLMFQTDLTSFYLHHSHTYYYYYYIYLFILSLNINNRTYRTK